MTQIKMPAGLGKDENKGIEDRVIEIQDELEIIQLQEGDWCLLCGPNVWRSRHSESCPSMPVLFNEMEEGICGHRRANGRIPASNQQRKVEEIYASYFVKGKDVTLITSKAY